MSTTLIVIWVIITLILLVLSGFGVYYIYLLIRNRDHRHPVPPSHIPISPPPTITPATPTSFMPINPVPR